MMEVWVITGGIGSGKSEVCHILKKHGISAQYDADSRVKALYAESPELLLSIERVLECTLKDDDGLFLPKRLAERIFSDKDALDKVEEIVFPALKKDFESFQDSHKSESVVIFESATILEKPYFHGFGDRIILVDAPYDLRLLRASSRDNVSKEIIEKRMSNQVLMNRLSEGMKDPRIDTVIVNDGTHEELEDKVAALMEGCNNK